MDMDMDMDVCDLAQTFQLFQLQRQSTINKLPGYQHINLAPACCLPLIGVWGKPPDSLPG